MKQIASGKLLCNTGSSAQCSVMTWRDGMGEAGREAQEGICVYLWLIHVVLWQKPTQHYKAIILQLKINLKIKFIQN